MIGHLNERVHLGTRPRHGQKIGTGLADLIYRMRNTHCRFGASETWRPYASALVVRKYSSRRLLIPPWDSSGFINRMLLLIGVCHEACV